MAKGHSTLGFMKQNACRKWHQSVSEHNPRWFSGDHFQQHMYGSN